MKIDDLVTKYREKGYALADARSTVCQYIILSKIANSNFKNNITIKGGVVMHSVSKSNRRATQDLDMDFIKYALDNEHIFNFINTLDSVDDGISVKLDGEIEELRHQDYKGKRIYIVLEDNFGNKLENKLDIGVHSQFNIEQDDYCFNIDFTNDEVNLLINSFEQIFAEKLKSLLKFGIRSGRHKDLFDFYYLINNTNLNKNRLLEIFKILIFDDELMRENNILDIYNRLNSIFNSRVYRANINNPKYNWLDVSIDDIINSVLNYVKDLKLVAVYKD